MSNPLITLTESWLARDSTSVLIVVLRRMPEGLVYASTEVKADAWDLLESDILGPVLVETLKEAEEGRVRRL